MDTPKSMAFGLSALLHLGLLCILGPMFIRPVVSNRILEITLTSWTQPVTSSKGKHVQHVAPKKVSESIVKQNTPVIRKSTPAKPVEKEIPRLKQKAVKKVSPKLFTKTPAVAHHAVKENSSPRVTESHTASAGEKASGDTPGRSYFAEVLARIKAAKHYPSSAARRHIEGNTVVTFRLAPDGRLLFSHLQKSSGYHMLDNAALEAVQDAAPFPAFADSGDTLPRSLRVTISFILNQ